MESSSALDTSLSISDNRSSAISRRASDATTDYSRLFTNPEIPRPSTGRRSRTAGSVFGDVQQVICAVSEGRGVSPMVGLAFVNISTGEAALSQICDNQFYSKTLNKLNIFEPMEILIVSTAGPPSAKSKMFSVIEDNVLGSKLVTIDRRYWSETAGLEYIQQLAFAEDVEALKVAIEGNYFATCCFAAVLKYIEYCYECTFALHSLRIKYTPSEGSMMIDMSTIQSLELIQNSQNSKSKDCLFGLLKHTQTPMGSRLLRSSILQPSTQKDTVLLLRYDAVEELTMKEEMFYAVRQALKSYLDVEKLLTRLIIFPTNPDIYYAEQSINNILILNTLLMSTNNVYNSLLGSRSGLLTLIREICRPERAELVMQMIRGVINEDVTYQTKPLDLRNQRTYAVKSGVSGLLDVARQTFKEVTEDIHEYVGQVNEESGIQTELRYDHTRRYHLRISDALINGRNIPDVFINRYRKKGFTECQTLYLLKLNQRLDDCHQEVVLMSDKTIQQLLDQIRGEMHTLFKIGEGVAMLDMLASFAHLATLNDYVKPELTDHVGIKAGRHPIKSKSLGDRFVPNDFYASDQGRFQIITGCNMSGKSTYIRSVALITVMAQIGCFVPAAYASLRIVNQLFARVSVDDCAEANVSTFAAEMRETAYILRNIDERSLAVIDELGRGTSSRDGLAIALSIAETLVDSGALVWFATHFRDLAQIMAERNGVVNLHLAVDINATSNHLKMLYTITDGLVAEDRYGLALARVVPLPPDVLAVADRVSTQLRAQAVAKKQSSAARATLRKRKLLLSLREQLRAAHEGPLVGRALVSWLARLQEEFVRRMEAIEDEADGESAGATDADIQTSTPDDEASDGT